MTNNNPELTVPRPGIRQRFRMASERFRRKMGLPTNDRMVHFIILSPSDKEPASTAMVGSVERAASHLQAWYRWQMSGKTFTFDVRAFRAPHTSNWYSTNPSGSFSQWFWNNVLGEASNQAGAGFYQPYNDWVIYIDAEPQPGQSAGGTSGGYISGCAVMGASDLRSLQGIDPTWTQCRGIGGSGHEYGHTHGLPHPVEQPPEVWARALMGVGYSTYPVCQLLPENQAQLGSNPFFQTEPHQPAPEGLCPFDDSATS